MLAQNSFQQSAESTSVGILLQEESDIVKALLLQDIQVSLPLLCCRHNTKSFSIQSVAPDYRSDALEFMNKRDKRCMALR